MLTLQRAWRCWAIAAVQNSDNPMCPRDPACGFPTRRRDRIRAWEEAPLLDEIAVNAGYRGTLVNLGLVCVGYDRLENTCAAGQANWPRAWA